MGCVDSCGHRQSREDPGFTLIELLVVMIIIGVLSSIAVPMLLNQRGKARDTATKSDLSRLAKEVLTYYVDGTGPAVIAYTAPAGGQTAILQVTDAGGYASGNIRMSAGTVRPGSGHQANLNSNLAWCVALTNPDGLQKTFSYTATGGLRTGSC